MISDLLSYHDNHPSMINFFAIRADEKCVRVDGHTQALNFEPTGEYNEYGGGELQLSPEELTEALIAVNEVGQWSKESFRIFRHSHTKPVGLLDSIVLWRARRPPDTLSLSIGGGTYSTPAEATLTRERADVLLLDAYEVTFSGAHQARTGMQLPASHLDAAFIDVLRENPHYLSGLSSVGLERTVLTMVNEAAGGPVQLERLVPDGSLLLARSTKSGRGAMLLSIQESSSREVSIDVVDRINGVRDRHSVSKAAIVTRSQFSADVERSYAGLSHRLELVDFDRLRGNLVDGGWTAHSSDFLTLPVVDRPAHSVFISYSWQQRPFARWLYEKLHGWQYDCFLDSVDIAPGDVILSSVKKALTGVDAVVLCCSTDSLRSSWVQTEIAECLDREKRTGKKMLIPVRLDDTPLKGDLAVINERLVLDFRGWDRRRTGDGEPLARLVTAIEGVLRQDSPRSR